MTCRQTRSGCIISSVPRSLAAKQHAHRTKAMTMQGGTDNGCIISLEDRVASSLWQAGLHHLFSASSVDQSSVPGPSWGHQSPVTGALPRRPRPSWRRCTSSPARPTQDGRGQPEGPANNHFGPEKIPVGHQRDASTRVAMPRSVRRRTEPNTAQCRRGQREVARGSFGS